MKVLIGIPSARDWKGATAVSFAAALVELSSHLGKSNIEVYNRPTPNLPNAREQMVIYAENNNFTHLIFFDDDMVIPAKAFVRLLKHDLDCVGIDYSKKKVTPYETTACADKDRDYRKLYNLIGMQKAGNMGFGCVALKVDMLRKLDKPMFMPNWHPDKLMYSTEDTPFFEQIIAKGFQPYIDMDLSYQCKHVGDCHYDLRDIAEHEVERHIKDAKEYMTKRSKKISYQELLNGIYR